MPNQFFQLPNVAYMLASFVHLAGMAVWVGGIVALGAIAAPTLFRRLPASDAGALFGPMLEVFEKVSTGAAIAAVAGAIAKGWIGEQNANVWMLVRWAALIVMVLLLATANTVVHPRIRALQAKTPGIGALPDSDPERRAFQKLHKLSERLMTGQLVCGLVVLLLA
jgi:hypothetical protein